MHVKWYILGLRFAMMEIKLILASILYTFRFVRTDKTQSSLDLDPRKTVFIAPKGEIILKIENHNKI